MTSQVDLDGGDADRAEDFNVYEPEESLGDAKDRLLRRSDARKDWTDEDFLERATELYLSWVEEDTYLFMEERERFDDYTKDDRVEQYGVKAAKRGNDVYRRRTLERFDEVRKVLPDVEFFDPEDRHGVKQTPAFFVTLTYDTEDVELVDAWDEVGEDYNRFRSRLQREFAERCPRLGKRGHRVEECEDCQDARIRQIRVFEGRSDGYPAPHALIVLDRELPVKYHAKSGSWRMATYDLKQRIGDCWSGGHVDVKAVHTLDGELQADGDALEAIDDPDAAQAVAADGGDAGGGAVDYMLKYLRKTLTVDVDAADDDVDTTHLRTLVMSWLTEKRMYSASSDWDEVMVEQRPNDLNATCVIQTGLDGEELSEVEVSMLGTFVLASDGDNPPPWRVDLEGNTLERALDVVLG